MPTTAYVGGILFELDCDGRYLTIVTASVGLLARPAADLAKLTISEVSGTDVGATFQECIRRVIASGLPESLEYTAPVPAGRWSFRYEIRPAPWARAEPERKTAVSSYAT